jgi:FkbM family methyltransferase
MLNSVINRCVYFCYSNRKLFKLLKLGISWRELKKLEKNKTKGFSVLFGKEIQITDSFWHLFGLREIFIDETYRFSSVKEHPYIIDCGANIGLSVIYFKQKFPQAIIDCFEPDEQIFKKLQHNVNQFNAENVTFHQNAVWVNNKDISFISDGSVGGHISEAHSEKSDSISAVRLKDFLNQKVDFLKIDIEGAEFDVIRDCVEELHNVENIFVEYHSSHEQEQMLGELLIFLKNAGFKVYIKEAWENMKHPFIEKKGPFFDLQLNIFGYRR